MTDLEEYVGALRPVKSKTIKREIVFHCKIGDGTKLFCPSDTICRFLSIFSGL
jgi:hypothetical protein